MTVSGGPSSKPPRPPRPPLPPKPPLPPGERPPNPRPPPLPPMGGRILSVECEPFTRGRGRVGRSPVVVDSEMCDAATLGHARVGLSPVPNKREGEEKKRVFPIARDSTTFSGARELIGEMTVQKRTYIANRAADRRRRLGLGRKSERPPVRATVRWGCAPGRLGAHRQTRVGGFASHAPGHA